MSQGILLIDSLSQHQAKILSEIYLSPKTTINPLGDSNMQLEVKLDVAKFKEILIHSWHLLPPEKQRELLQIGIIRESE